MSDKTQSQKMFLQELKDQLRRYMDIKKGLDSKANSLITITGTISIIFAAFGTFTITEIIPRYSIWPIVLGVVIVVEVLITMLAIKSASDAYRARQYTQPIVYESLWDQKNNSVNEEIIRQYITSEQKDVYEKLISEYILCIKSYQEQNKLQVRDIERAQARFHIALFSIPIFVAVVVISIFFA